MTSRKLSHPEVKRILREYDRIQQQYRMLEEEERGLVEELKDNFRIDIDKVRP